MKTRLRSFFVVTLVVVAVAWIAITAFNYKYNLARGILGKDFIPPEKIAIEGLDYSKWQLLIFHFTLPSRDVLLWCRNNGYMVIAGPSEPIALNQVFGIFSRDIYDISRVPPGGWVHETWYLRPEEKFFREEKIGPAWLLIRKTPVPGSTNHTWQEQVKLLSPEERVPKAVEVAWAILVYHWICKEKLFPKTFVRTSSIDAQGLHVNTGYFDQHGLPLNDDYDERREPYYGISSARRLK